MDGQNKGFKTFALWIALFLLIFVAINYIDNIRPTTIKISYTQFIQEVEKNEVKSIKIKGKEILGEYKSQKVGPNGEKSVLYFKTIIPFEDPELANKLVKSGVDVVAKEPAFDWTGILISTLPILLIIFIWIIMMRQVQGGGKAFTFGKTNPHLANDGKNKVTFADVAGEDEAKEELQEIVDFLKNPKKYRRLGGKIPRGALLVGPPGTGKTLLAKAVAGEANVPFLTISASEFVEMFVGVGASRVRDLFEQGRQKAPCIIFIDEIDAVGRHRGAGLGGGHDEREQTLNQLLAEMDGFSSHENVILLAATNRPDVLDPALLRPGRFDRQIVVDRPDIKGREEILIIHMKKIVVGDDVDVKVIARGTPGLVGADLANLVNESALLAARKNKIVVEMEDFEEAKDKIMMGTARKSLVITDEEKKLIAYHEAGHTLVTYYTPGADPLYKVTIIPRGRALGLTHALPTDERHTYSKDYMLGELAILMGGREAERLMLGPDKITTGAGNDLERATELAKKMVCKWGMSEEIGPLAWRTDKEVFLGRDIVSEREYSDKTAEEIDNAVKNIVLEAEKKARILLTEHKDELEAIANNLLEKESLTSKEIDAIISSIKES